MAYTSPARCSILYARGQRTTNFWRNAIHNFAQFYSLLLPAARATCQPEHLERLGQKAVEVSTWQGLVEFAEAQRMAPLFYAHARKAEIALLEDAWLQLQGLSLRHHLASQARARVFEDVIPACQSAGIDVVLLKGAALAQLAYPQPGLRPMRDIDLLARPAQAQKLRGLLVEMGFQTARAEPGKPVSARHLPELGLQKDGFRVTVEIHDRLFDPTWRVLQRGPRLPTDAWIDRARPFAFGSLTAHTLCLEDMLWHTYQHMINEEIRLISIADLVSLSEKYVDDIDWEKIEHGYPGILQALGLFHAFSPLDTRLVQLARIPICEAPLKIGEDLQGWPRISLRQAREVGLFRFLQHTFWPSVWWLRLYYGIENGQTIPFVRGVIHPFEIVRLALRHLELRLSLPMGK